MNSTLALIMLVSLSCCYCLPLENIFEGYIQNANLNAPRKESEVVKRRILENNHEAELKQISLQSLIGDLENSLVDTALSVGNVAHDDKLMITEVKPNLAGHASVKRHVQAVSDESAHEKVQKETQESDNGNILLQTTERVPAKDGVPAHILIDRISVQPHYGNSVPLLPTFQVHHTKLISATVHEDGTNATKISIIKTDIQATTGNDLKVSTATEHDTEVATTISVAAVDATTLTTEATYVIPTTTPASTNAPNSSTSTTTTTTKAPLEQLKDAEEELKEKVAEIEAEPVILSARV